MRALSGVDLRNGWHEQERHGERAYCTSVCAAELFERRFQKTCSKHSNGLDFRHKRSL